MKCSSSVEDERESSGNVKGSAAAKSMESTKKNSDLFSCVYCKYSSDKSANLNRHIRTMHEVTKVLFCCGLKFTSKAEYREHNKTFHKEGHRCGVCGKCFTRRALLKRHQSVHTGIKDFKCEFCSYSSSHKSNVVRHLKIHRGLLNIIEEKKQQQQEQMKKKQLMRHPEPDSTTPLSSSTGWKKGTENSTTEVVGRSPEMLHSMYKTEKDIKPIVTDDKDNGKKMIKHSIESILQSGGKRSSNSSSSNGGDSSIMRINGLQSVGNDRRIRQPSETIVVEVKKKEGETMKKNYATNKGACKGKEWESGLQQLQNSMVISSNMNNTEANDYTLANIQPTYLAAIDINSLPVNNWTRSNSLCLPSFATSPSIALLSSSSPSSSTPPYAASLYGLTPGFGSIFGLEESRYLSSPHLQSTTTGIPVVSTTSAFRHHHHHHLSRPEHLIQPEGFHYFTPPLLPSPHLFSVSSNSAVDLTAGSRRASNNNNMYHFKIPLASSSTGASSSTLTDSEGAGVSHSDFSEACLSFSQVSNSQMTHFVSY